MEALAMLKFWKTTTAKVAVDGDFNDGDNSTLADSSTISDALADFSDDDDDSFFELELTKPNPISQTQPKPTSKPQSPISILRSASPKLNIFMLRKPNKKLSPSKKEFIDTTDSGNTSYESQKSNNLFTVKFHIEDGSIVPKLTRTTSNSSSKENYYESSKRFSKDVVQKYLNFVKPLYVKSSRKFGDGGGGGCSPTRSSSSFPSPRKEERQSSRFNFSKKQLGKSRSATAMMTGAPASSPVRFPARSEVSGEGIEGAILHCKLSLHTTTSSSKGSSLSRCSSDPSHEKSIQVSVKEI